MSEYRVLAVDDSAMMLKVIAKHLQGTEFEVVQTANNADDGIRFFDELRPDLVLLDIIMPGKPGDYALQKIMEIDPNAKVVILSSYGVTDQVSLCLTHGALRFLQKPRELPQLPELLRETFQSIGISAAN